MHWNSSRTPTCDDGLVTVLALALEVLFCTDVARDRYRNAEAFKATAFPTADAVAL